MGGEEDIGAWCRVFFNRSTPAGALDFPYQLPDERGNRFERHPVPVHVLEEGAPIRIHKVHFAKIQGGLSTPNGGLGSLPALAQLGHPRPREPAFQPEAEFLRAI